MRLRIGEERTGEMTDKMVRPTATRLVWGLVLLTAVGCSRGPRPAENLPELAAAEQALSWPRLMGPHGDNVSPATGLLKEWPKDGPPLAWFAKGLGDGHASVTIGGGRIYTSGNVGDATAVTALNLDGSRAWQTPNGPAWTRDYPGARGTPTLDGDRVYHESPMGQLACFDAASGEKLWSVDLLDEFQAENIQWGLAESVLVDGDRVIACPGGKKASIVALDKRTGKTVWTAEPGDKAGYASPILVEQDGLRMILAMTSAALIGVDADTGASLFRHEHRTQYEVNATTPIYSKGRVLITSGYGAGAEMLALSVDGKKAAVQRLWQVKDFDNHHGGVVLRDGLIYGAASNGKWFCIDWQSGDVRYNQSTFGKGTLTSADGMLYLLSEKRDAALAPATAEGLTIISRFKMPDGGGDQSWAYPVVCNGRLYLRHGDQLFAYDVRAR